MKLNIGCGHDILPGYINADGVNLPGVDVVCDFDVFPWPWEDNSATEVFMRGSLEHFKSDPITVLREVRRILKPGGIVRVLVPHYQGSYAVMPGHLWYFSVNWFMFIGVGSWYAADNGPMFEQVELKLNVFVGRLSWLDKIASWKPFAWEKLSPLKPDNIWYTGRKICVI